MNFSISAFFVMLAGMAAGCLGVAPGFADFDARARAGEQLRVVFFGASLTWGANAANPNVSSYRGQMMQRLTAAYPNARFAFHDAAIGGTGSRLGVFRLDRDVLAHHPDLVFVDFSANDDIFSAHPASLASYEAIIRRIIIEAHAPVVQVIFPFLWNTSPAELPNMHRRDAHLKMAAAYHTAVGDAIKLAQDRIASGEVTAKEIWPLDGVHPCEKGYQLFADAAWEAFKGAIEQKTVCAVPSKMLYEETYMRTARVRISSLGTLPQGWSVGQPNRVSAYFDMLMSRWLDDEVIAANRVISPENLLTESPQGVERLRVSFSGKHVSLFGESTPQSGSFRAYIDGKAVVRPGASADDPDRNLFDPGKFARQNNGNVHLDTLLSDDLDPSVPHTLEIEPIFAPSTAGELRIESICVAGGEAWVKLDK